MERTDIGGWKGNDRSGRDRLRRDETTKHTKHTKSGKQPWPPDSPSALKCVGAGLAPAQIAEDVGLRGGCWRGQRKTKISPGNPPALYNEAAKVLLSEGAVFTRPYGDLAPIVYDKAATYARTLKRLKKVFDPNNIMNPGNLCF